MEASNIPKQKQGVPLQMQMRMQKIYTICPEKDEKHTLKMGE